MTLSPIRLNAYGHIENFNSLPRTGAASSSQLPQGWDFVEVGAGADSTLVADDGSSTQVGAHNYGAEGSSDRAFGEFSTGSNHPILGAVFVNDTQTPLATSNFDWSNNDARNADPSDP